MLGKEEAQGGTVDKYMGDAVMAFWGASEDPGHGAEQACRAALDIAAMIRKDNRVRQENEKHSVGMRIGIHTCIATIGNIGPPGRLNYTVIGDTVNIGQRLEQLGKDIHKLKGRVGEIDIVKLEGLSTD